MSCLGRKHVKGFTSLGPGLTWRGLCSEFGHIPGYDLGCFFSAPQFFRFTEHEGGGKAEPGAKRTLSRWKQVLSTYKGGRKWAVV